MISPALARTMKMFRIRNMVPNIPACRGNPNIRIEKIAQMRQGTPTTNARALGRAEENCRESQAMMDEIRTIAQMRCKPDTTHPNATTSLEVIVCREVEHMVTWFSYIVPCTVYNCTIRLKILLYPKRGGAGLRAIYFLNSSRSLFTVV